MYDDIDWTNPHDVERMRRSIAMHSGTSPALTNDQIDRLLGALIDALHQAPKT